VKNKVCALSGLKAMSFWKVLWMQRFESITTLGYTYIFSTNFKHI